MAFKPLASSGFSSITRGWQSLPHRTVGRETGRSPWAAAGQNYREWWWCSWPVCGFVFPFHIKFSLRVHRVPVPPIHNPSSYWQLAIVKGWREDKIKVCAALWELSYFFPKFWQFQTALLQFSAPLSNWVEWVISMVILEKASRDHLFNDGVRIALHMAVLPKYNRQPSTRTSATRDAFGATQHILFKFWL